MIYFYLYKITSPSNKVYIGQTRNLSGRKSCYKYLRCKGQPLLYNSLKKYSWDNHVFEIIKEGFMTTQEINKEEIKLILKYKNLKTSLNISDGGNLATHRIGKFGTALKKYDLIQFELSLNEARRK